MVVVVRDERIRGILPEGTPQEQLMLASDDVVRRANPNPPSSPPFLSSGGGWTILWNPELLQPTGFSLSEPFLDFFHDFKGGLAPPEPPLEFFFLSFRGKATRWVSFAPKIFFSFREKFTKS